MRNITTHHDGHKLNESIIIIADEAGPGGASHLYHMGIDGHEVATIQFQKGPRNEKGSTPGVTEAAIMAMLIDRLQMFQEGEYKCRENAIVLTHLETALLWSKKRADDRAKRGVLGTMSK